MIACCHLDYKNRQFELAMMGSRGSSIVRKQKWTMQVKEFFNRIYSFRISDLLLVFPSDQVIKENFPKKKKKKYVLGWTCTDKGKINKPVTD